MGTATAPDRAQLVASAYADAEAASGDIEVMAERLAIATCTEMELEDGRTAEKSFAIRRLMQFENPETKKPHSASSAEKVIELDDEYMAYRRKQYDSVVEKIRAQGAFDAAKMRARLAVAAYAECVR